MAAPGPDMPGAVVRPPRLYLAALALGLGLDYLAPTVLAPGGLSPRLRVIGAAVLAAAGLALLVACMRRFRRAGTPVPTILPTTALVTDGPYRRSRNPIYVALTLLYAGLAVAADSLWALGLLVPVLAVMRWGVIAREERYLERKFGEDYRRYRARVRRWL